MEPCVLVPGSVAMLFHVNLSPEQLVARNPISHGRFMRAKKPPNWGEERKGAKRFPFFSPAPACKDRDCVFLG